MQVGSSLILAPVQQGNQSYHKSTIYAGNLDSNVSIEYICELSGLKWIAYLRTNCHVDFPLNQQTQKTRGFYVYIKAPNHVCDELDKLYDVKFKDNFLFIEIAKVKPKAANPNKINFTSPYRFEPLRFMNYRPGLGNDIDHSEENDLCVEFKRTVRNSQQNYQQNSKRRTPVVVNDHPENQTFSKYQ